MKCSLYPFELLFETNIIIHRIIVLFDFMQSSNSCSYNLDLTNKYNVIHDTTTPNFYVKDELCCESKLVEMMNHGLHSSCIFRNLVET